MRLLKANSARAADASVYDYYQYSHIGRFHCDHDGFGKIEPDDIEVTD